MNEREAQELVRMCETNWSMRLDARWRARWRDALLPYEAELGTRAVTNLAKRQREKLMLPDLATELLRLRRNEQENEAWRELPPERAAKPAWVIRWEKARAVDDRRPFPEQISGYIELQEESYENMVAYELPAEQVDDPEVWVQEHEYA